MLNLSEAQLDGQGDQNRRIHGIEENGSAKTAVSEYRANFPIFVFSLRGTLVDQPLSQFSPCWPSACKLQYVGQRASSVPIYNGREYAHFAGLLKYNTEVGV